MTVDVLTSLRQHRRERSKGTSNAVVAMSSAKHMGISHELKPAPGHLGPPGCSSQEAWDMLENPVQQPQFPKRIKVPLQNLLAPLCREPQP